MENIYAGLSGESTLTVTDELTARHLGSGGVRVFATPAMVSLMERAAVLTIDPLLPEGRASVGIEIHVKHLAATPVGSTVRARATVTLIDRRRVEFEVQAWDEYELIGEGTHVRFVIDVEKYQARVADKLASSTRADDNQ